MKLQNRWRLGVLILVLAAKPALADVMIYSSAGPVQPDENVQYNDPGLIATGAFVTGATNQTTTILKITSLQTPQVALTTPSSGQARVEAINLNDNTQILFNSVMLTFENPQLGFSELEFNLNTLNSQSGQLQLSFTGVGFDPFTVTQASDNSPLALTNGSNFIGIEALNNRVITSVTITSLQGNLPSSIIEDIRQIRVSAAPIPFNGGGGGGGGGSQAVPEPASGLLWGCGAVALIAFASFRRRGKSERRAA
jgi:hypothetical protein